MDRILKWFVIVILVLVIIALAGLMLGNALDVSAAPLAAATPVAVQEIVVTGLTPAFTAASADAAGNTFVNDGNTFAYIKNGYTGTITATFVTPRTVGGLAVADQMIAVASGAEAAVGDFLPETFNDSSGQAQVTWSETTTVTFAVMSW